VARLRQFFGRPAYSLMRMPLARGMGHGISMRHGRAASGLQVGSRCSGYHQTPPVLGGSCTGQGCVRRNRDTVQAAFADCGSRKASSSTRKAVAWGGGAVLQSHLGPAYDSQSPRPSHPISALARALLADVGMAAGSIASSTFQTRISIAMTCQPRARDHLVASLFGSVF
jgi:hypothetical protein